jgi:hypothetical protein
MLFFLIGNLKILPSCCLKKFIEQWTSVQSSPSIDQALFTLWVYPYYVYKFWISFVWRWHWLWFSLLFSFLWTFFFNCLNLGEKQEGNWFEVYIPDLLKSFQNGVGWWDPASKKSKTKNQNTSFQICIEFECFVFFFKFLVSFKNRFPGISARNSYGCGSLNPLHNTLKQIEVCFCSVTGRVPLNDITRLPEC